MPKPLPASECPRPLYAWTGGPARAAYGLADRAPLRELVERSAAARVSATTILFVMFHPSRTVRNTLRSMEAQREDWRGLVAGSRGLTPKAR
jgi:uracil-DNA glycosylase